jgi:hypothetical protein
MATNVRNRPSGRIAYLRGKPAADWISALSKRRPAADHAPLADRRS